MNILEENRKLAEELLFEAHKFYRFRYQMSDGGNISARIPGTQYMIVKGSNVDFGSLDMGTLAVTDLEGRSMEGKIKPSKESMLHGAIYQAFPHIGAIVHCHSPWATAWAACHDTLEFATHHARMKLGENCPVFDTNSYVVPKEYFPLIIEAMGLHPQMKAFLLRGHGQVAYGKDMHDAAMAAELVEETAMIARLSFGGSKPI